MADLQDILDLSTDLRTYSFANYLSGRGGKILSQTFTSNNIFLDCSPDTCNVVRPPSNPRTPAASRRVRAWSTPETTPPRGTYFPTVSTLGPKIWRSSQKADSYPQAPPIPSSASAVLPTPLDVEHPTYKQHLRVSPSRPLVSHSLRVTFQVYGTFCPFVPQSSLHATIHRTVGPKEAPQATAAPLPRRNSHDCDNPVVACKHLSSPTLA